MPKGKYSLADIESGTKSGTYSLSDIGTPTPDPLAGSIGPAPTGIKPWLYNLESDIRTGGTMTGPGRLLHRLGARGLESGVSKGAAEFVGSPLLGPIHAAQGVAETPEHPIRGPLKAVGGALETMTLPAAFVAPEVVPSASRAGTAFQEVMAVAKANPVDIAAPGRVAIEIDKLAQAGGSRPKVISDFLRRVTDPKKGPLTYEEARNFYQNATRLSFDEMNRLTPNVRRLVGEFTSELNGAIRSTAGKVGKLKQYDAAMREYHNAAKFQRQLDALKKYAIKAIPYAAGAYATERIISDRPAHK